MAARSPATHRASRLRLSPEEVNARIVEVCEFYCGGSGQVSGRRISWSCPFCQKRKLEVLPEGPVGGCWNTSCPVPTSTDALGLAAFFEDLDRASEFARLMVRLDDVLRGGGASFASADGPRKPAAREPSVRVASASDGRTGTQSKVDPDVAHAAYEAVLSSCPPTGPSRTFWAGRGVAPETVRRARLGFASPKRAMAAVAEAERRLGRERLLSVPGFFCRDGEARPRVRFTLTGEYHLIPYHDRSGRVTTIEGRATDRQRRHLAAAGINAKYVSLRESGNHLYIFPGLPLDAIEAFTEGTVGAIVAAQEGLCVGAIEGIRCHALPDGSPLPEISGAAFGGKVVPYIPDADWPPNPDVLREAPKAARNLTLPHGGKPALAHLPRGLDLDEWLISLPEPDRRPAFRDLIARASPLEP